MDEFDESNDEEYASSSFESEEEQDCLQLRNLVKRVRRWLNLLSLKQLLVDSMLQALAHILLPCTLK
jgi:hypothetical protein